MQQHQPARNTQPRLSHLLLQSHLWVKFFWLVLSLLPGGVQAQPETGPYALSWKTDASLLGLGALTGITTLISDNQAKVPTMDYVNALNRNQVNAFDRGATYKYSSQAGTVSDQALNGSFLVAGAVAIPALIRAKGQWAVVPIMFLETLALPTTIQQTVKNVFPRNRPFMYNPDAPLSEKLTKNGRQSFFSGHAGTSFATAVFTSEMFRHYFPHSRLRPVVWVVSLGLATTVSVARYEAGRHFPSDIITGAAFGSLLGWGIPKLHEVHTRSAMARPGLARRLTLQPWSSGQASGVYARFTL